MRWATLLGLLVSSTAYGADPIVGDMFEKTVRPIFIEHCYGCHGPKKQNAGLRLDTMDGIRKGADDGPIFVAGKPSESRIVKAVERTADAPMPPDKAIPKEAVAAIKAWIEAGAALPAEVSKTATKLVNPQDHWAFRPVVDPPVPPLGKADPIDAFVLKKLNDLKLSTGSPASKRTLIRRLSFDLIGLPPTYEETEAYIHDNNPNATEKLVDRLLASPHFGERWARHWMDLSRYSDTKGYVFTEDRNYPFAYTYRDYLIRSFNEDKPYNRFIVEQLAADRLELGKDKRPLAALGYITLGRRFLNNQTDIIDDRIDVVTRGFLGLTVGCARCHDHKFDPIPTADYYSLYGVFASSHEPKDLPLIEEVKRTKEVIDYEADLAKKQKAADEFSASMITLGQNKFRKAGSISAYMVAVTMLNGKTAKEVDDYTIKRKLDNKVLDRWRAFLQHKDREKDPVFAAWLAIEAKKPLPAFIDKNIKDALNTAKPENLYDAADLFGELLAGPFIDRLHTPDAPPSLDPKESERFIPIVVKQEFRKLRNAAEALKANNPFAPPRAMALQDNDKATEPVVFLRGNPATPGPSVPRQFPAAISGPDRKPFTNGSGRLDLANAIADPKNPLTARVYVNRIWVHLFGQGLVNTPSDFGTRAEPPTHPELLDWLAARFVQDGWSTKKVIRRIVLSQTYQQSSATSPDQLRSDPDNRWLAHQTRKRLEFEPLRDSILFSAGKLDPTIGGKSVELFQNPSPTRRTLYGHIDRQNLPGTFRAFDFAGPDTHAPQRFQTTVPQQALFLMNSPFILEQTKALAAKAATNPEPSVRVVSLYRATLSRNPTPEEMKQSIAFVETAETEGNKLNPWEQLAQVLLVCNEFVFVD